MLSSPRRRGPIRCALSTDCGVWVPALASLGRDDKNYNSKSQYSATTSSPQLRFFSLEVSVKPAFS
jgi:hypothetical protein